eukprot:5783804-Pyramimonas_sp.AAC.1
MVDTRRAEAGIGRREEGRAEIGAAPPCGPWHLGLRWNSLWGHETRERRAEMGAAALCERSQWGFR